MSTTDTTLTTNQNQLLENWFNAQNMLASLKAQEMELRKQVVAEFFDAEDREGTKRYDLPDGYKLKVVKKQNYKLNNKDGQVDAALELLNDDTLAALLVKWTPDLSLTNYKTLTDEVKAIFNGCLEITDAAPALEIEAPKAKK